MYLLPGELHAAITCPAGERVIGIDRTGCPESVGGKAFRCYVILRDQRLLDRGGAAFRQVEVVGISANVVCMAIYGEVPVRDCP